MVIVFHCPGCKKQFEIDGANAGKRSRCKTCGAEFRVPVPTPPRATPAPASASDVPARSTSLRPPARGPLPVAVPVPEPRDDAPARAKGPMDDLFDEGPAVPAALRRNSPTSAPAAHSYAMDEDLPPPPPRSSYGPKPKSRKRRGGSSYDAVAASDIGAQILYGFALIHLIATLAVYSYMIWGGGAGTKGGATAYNTYWAFALVASGALALSGAVWMFVIGFESCESKVVYCIFMPLYSLISIPCPLLMLFFAVRHWDERRGPFGLMFAPLLAGIVWVVPGFAVMGIWGDSFKEIIAENQRAAQARNQPAAIPFAPPPQSAPGIPPNLPGLMPGAFPTGPPQPGPQFGRPMGPMGPRPPFGPRFGPRGF